MKIELANNFYLQPELLFALQGTKYNVNLLNVVLPGSDPVFGESVKGKINESTILLLLMIKYYVIDKLNFEFGPHVDYIFKSIDKVEGGNELSMNPNDFNFGLNLGVGFDFGEKAGVGLRYNFGFNRADEGFPSKIKNSIFSLNFEYRFN